MIQLDITINVHRSSRKIPDIHASFESNLNTRILDRFSKKPKIKFRENLSTGSLVVPCWQTGGQTRQN